MHPCEACADGVTLLSGLKWSLPPVLVGWQGVHFDGVPVGWSLPYVVVGVSCTGATTLAGDMRSRNVIAGLTIRRSWTVGGQV